MISVQICLNKTWWFAGQFEEIYTNAIQQKHLHCFLFKQKYHVICYFLEWHQLQVTCVFSPPVISLSLQSCCLTAWKENNKIQFSWVFRQIFSHYTNPNKHGSMENRGRGGDDGRDSSLEQKQVTGQTWSRGIIMEDVFWSLLLLIFLLLPFNVCVVTRQIHKSGDQIQTHRILHFP